LQQIALRGVSFCGVLQSNVGASFSLLDLTKEIKMEKIKNVYNWIKEKAKIVWDYLEAHPKTSRFVYGFATGFVIALFI
jgi:hypothetical protein